MHAFRSALLASLLLVPAALAQDAPQETDVRPGVQFNGLGRAFIQEADLGGRVMDTDTTTAGTLADGEFVLDLAVSAQPNRTTEVQGVLRFRNEFGGFFGSGVTVEVRELWARGVVANALAYRLGDMDLALTPFTVFLPEEDGRVNTPELFEPQKEVVYYEEFYTGQNERRFQGGRFDFGLDVSRGLEAVEVGGFLARLRPTDFTNTPTRLIGGGRIGATTPTIGSFGSQVRAGVNYVSVWDDLESGDANTGIRNHVVTVDADVSLLDRDGLSVSLVGEGGGSVAKRSEELDLEGEAGGGMGNVEGSDLEDDLEPGVLFREADTFIEAGIRAELASRDLEASALFVNVGPDFFSAAAQSKRVDYTRSRGLFNRIGNDRDQRTIGLFDLTRDPSIYTFRLEDQLMAYDPRYGNVLPYGRATPNRRGVRLAAAFEPESGPARAEILVALLREIRGQGTTELKDFALVRAAADVSLSPLIGYSRGLGVTLGLQLENTSRGGEPIEAVDLSSVLIEAGLTAEIYDRLDALVGLKTRTSSGRDYVPQLREFNDVRDFPAPFVTDDSELLAGAGLRYRFGDDIFLTVQYQRYTYGADATPDDDFSIGQVFALYSMDF
ncbi:hypothetical protein [Rubrivirga sp.]|uniref:hypothetical protein n=1 Tax=Rubrivirga sp. TaxID=1885344 RepID=UPI003C7829C2